MDNLLVSQVLSLVAPQSEVDKPAQEQTKTSQNQAVSHVLMLNALDNLAKEVIELTELQKDFDKEDEENEEDDS